MRPAFVLAFLALAGCAHDDWTFRPLADDAEVDAAPTMPDAPAVDAAAPDAPVVDGAAAPDAPTDAASPPEVSVADVPLEAAGEDVARADASLAPDAPEVPTPPGLALRVAGFATVAAAPAVPPRGLRLVEGGFAGSARVCSDGLCMTGGLE